MVMDIGPFRFYRADCGTLDISLKILEDYPLGWEYGWEDPARGSSKPWISFRIGKLNVLYFETWEKGFEFWFLGFWVII
jgi:hypothetical protein